MNENFNIEEWYKQHLENASFDNKNDVWQHIDKTLDDIKLENWYKQQVNKSPLNNQSKIWNNINQSLNSADVEQWYKQHLENDASFDNKNDVWDTINESLENTTNVEQWYQQQIENLSFENKTTLWRKIDATLDRLVVWQRISKTLKHAESSVKLFRNVLKLAALFLLLLLPLSIDWEHIMVYPKQISNNNTTIIDTSQPMGTSVDKTNEQQAELHKSKKSILTNKHIQTNSNRTSEKTTVKPTLKSTKYIDKNNKNKQASQINNGLDNTTNYGNKNKEEHIALPKNNRELFTKLPKITDVDFGRMVETNFEKQNKNFKETQQLRKSSFGIMAQAQQNWMFSNTLSKAVDRNSLTYFEQRIDYAFGVFYTKYFKKIAAEITIMNNQKGQRLMTYTDGKNQPIDYRLNYIISEINISKNKLFAGVYTGYLYRYTVNDVLSDIKKLKTMDLGVNIGYQTYLLSGYNMNIYVKWSQGIVNINKSFNNIQASKYPLYNSAISLGMKYSFR